MFSFSGIWESPQTTIPAVLAGLAGIIVALGWLDAETAGRYATVAGSIIIAVIGALYKKRPVE